MGEGGPWMGEGGPWMGEGGPVAGRGGPAVRDAGAARSGEHGGTVQWAEEPALPASARFAQCCCTRLPKRLADLAMLSSLEVK